MSKVLLDFETYNRLRELAHDAVDTAIKTVFSTMDGSSNRIVESVSTYHEMRFLIEKGKMKGFNYRDWESDTERYNPDFKWEYRFPCTVYGDSNSKKWWVDIHNLSENHPCFNRLLNNLVTCGTKTSQVLLESK